MDITILGATLTTFGLLLTIWSLIYARQQSKKVSDLKRNQNITLWATLSRVARSISDIVKITDDEGFINSGQLTEKQKQILPKVHRGITDQYIRLAELIVQNDPGLTIKQIESWHNEKRPGVESDWRMQQFFNLITAGKHGNSSNKSI